jgi:hypothetical protein
MKRSDIEALVSSIIDDKHLINQVYAIVKSKLKDDWKNCDARWCNMVINYAIEQTLDDLALVDLVKSLKRKYPSKKRRDKAVVREDVNETNVRDAIAEEKGTENSIHNNNENKNNFINQGDLSRASSEVKPIFSSTEPIQITTSPGRRHKAYATTGEPQKLPSTHKINKLPGKLPPSSSSARGVSDGRSLFHDHDQSGLEVSNVITKGISNSNDDQVLIQMSNEGDNISEDSFEKDVLPSPSHRHPISIDSNDQSDRSHMIKKKPSQDQEEDDNNINSVSEPIEESYADDFEEMNSSMMSKIAVATWAPTLTASDNDTSHTSEKKVEFSNPVVTVINERDKCSKEEVSELFYTHDESIKFENDYAKELEKAEVLGLTWADWIAKRTEEDILREEQEEEENNMKYLEEVDEDWELEDTEDETDGAAADYENDEFEVYQNQSNTSEDLYDF